MLLNDVIKDTVELKTLLTTYQKHINDIDTLQQLRRIQGTGMNDFDFWYFCDAAFTAGRISFNDATMQQVKNSGNLRYFHSLKLKEKIGEYDNITGTFSLRLEIELNWVPILMSFYNSLFDYDTRLEVEKKLKNGSSPDSLRKVHYHFLTKDADEINRFLNFSDYRSRVWKNRITVNLSPTLEIARQLINLLKSEYDFSDSD